MSNFKLRNLFVVLFLLFSLTLTYGCSSKPNEDDMKSIIKKILVGENEVPADAQDIEITNFEITESHYIELRGENYYCITANLGYSYTEDGERMSNDLAGVRFSFVKREKIWMGLQQP